jgi:signal transduction histidine kinase/ligand-binding sensor domain-containing protein
MTSPARTRLPGLVLVPVLLLLLAPVRARAGDTDNLLTGYSLTSWIEANGRTLGTVYAIAQHQDGYLWIGSHAGLFRFDGSRFAAWEDTSDTPLPASAVTAVYVARDGSIWVGFADGGGIWRISNGHLEPQDHGLTMSGAIADLVEDGAGTIWAVIDGVLYSLVDNRWQNAAIPWRTSSGRVLQTYVSHDGDLWIATRWGIFHRSMKTQTFLPAATGFIWGISEDPSGTFWTTDIAAGFRRLASPAPPREAPQGAGYRLLHDRKGNLWVATFSEGLWRVPASAQARGTPLERADLRTGLASDSVQSLLEDRDGDIWVGTTGGLHRLVPRPLTPVNNVGFVVTIEPSDDGRMWACRTNGVLELSADHAGWAQARTGSAGPDIRSLYRDPHGTLWVGATEGLFRWQAGRLVPVRLPDPGLSAMQILPEAHGALWLNDGAWLYRWDGTRLTRLDVPQSAGLTRISFAGADRSGRVWIGFNGGRLAVLDAHGVLHLMDASDGIEDDPSRSFYAVFEDDQGMTWFGSSRGLSRMIDGRLQTISRANGLPEDRVWAITQDLQGLLWLTVDRGLVRLDRREVLRALANPIYPVRYRLFDTSDGLAGTAIGIIRSARASDGTLWFVRGGGLTIVNPRDLVREQPPSAPPVRIETVIANERRLSPAPGQPFPPGTRRLQINYAVLNLGTHSGVRFRYRLDGVDASWVDAGVRRGAFYTNLAPGRYEFRVEALADNGTWNASAANWKFSIEPAFYRTTWFDGLCAASILLTFWGLWRFRLEFVRQQFALALAERVRMSREIHDTLLQSLVGVMLQFDAIAKNLGPVASPLKDQLVRIQHQIEAHIREARDLIHNLRSPLLERQGLSKVLVEFGAQAVTDSAVHFESTIVGSPSGVPPDAESHLLRIGQEAITNAIRHAHAGNIRLELRFEAGSVTLRVADDGCGFDYDRFMSSGNHYGLTTMRERAEQLGGTFRVATVVGEGTLVEAIVPVPDVRTGGGHPQ